MVDSKRQKYRIALKDLPALMDEVLSLADAELMLLKAHLLVERVLVAATGVRLRENDDEQVPKLPFGTLVDLAAADDGERKTLIWFNDLRNALAHEFHALDGAEFQKTISLFGVSWPSDAEARTRVMFALVHVVILVATQTYYDQMAKQVTLERAPRLSKEAARWLEQTILIRKSLQEARGQLRLAINVSHEE
jgi:uncharacterized protein YutE (UPF0331/DUF86 family)